MKRRKNIFLFLWLTWFIGCGPPVDPKITTWDVRELILFKNLTVDEFRSLPVGDLLKKDKVIITDSRLRTLFQRAKFSTKTPISKGKIESVVRLNSGQYKKLWISHYGSFFGVIDQKRKGFFYFKGDDAKVWDEVIFEVYDAEHKDTHQD